MPGLTLLKDLNITPCPVHFTLFLIPLGQHSVGSTHFIIVTEQVVAVDIVLCYGRWKDPPQSSLVPSLHPGLFEDGDILVGETRETQFTLGT